MASSDGETTTTARLVRAEPPADGDDWNERHARIDRMATTQAVHADPPRDDWDARHCRTRRSD